MPFVSERAKYRLGKDISDFLHMVYVPEAHHSKKEKSNAEIIRNRIRRYLDTGYGFLSDLCSPISFINARQRATRELAKRIRDGGAGEDGFNIWLELTEDPDFEAEELRTLAKRTNLRTKCQQLLSGVMITHDSAITLRGFLPDLKNDPRATELMADVTKALGEYANRLTQTAEEINSTLNLLNTTNQTVGGDPELASSAQT